MAGNNAWDRTILNSLERPLSSDINQALSQVDRSLREAILAAWNGNGGFLNSAFAPESTANPLEVRLKAGMAFIIEGASDTIDGIPGLDDRATNKPVLLTADQTITTSAPPGGGLERYDLVEIRTNRRRTNSSSRDVLDAVTGIFNASALLKTLAFDVDGDVGVVASPAASTAAISIKTGTPAGTGTAAVPAGTAGYTPVAVLYVPNGTTTLANKVRDLRSGVRLGLSGASAVAVQFTKTIGAPDVVALSLTGGAPNSGMKFGILPGAGPNTAVRLFFFCGASSTRPALSSINIQKVSGTGTKSLHAAVNSAGSASLASVDATALQGAPNLLNVAAGQECFIWDVDAVPVTGVVSNGDVLSHNLLITF